MADKIKSTGWNYDVGYYEHESRDEYETIKVQAAKADLGSPHYDDWRLIDQRLFIHEPTGIVTADVEKFEAWLDKVVTR